jgi:hypothetical protein
MTGKDKTEDQLLSSIRRNKPSAKAAPRKKTVKKAAPRKSAVARKPPTSDGQARGGDAYRSVKRVWPD